MKVAVLLVGNIRTWDYCKPSFTQNFGHLNPDIFVATYNKRYNHHPYIQGTTLEGDTSDSELSNQEIVDMFSDMNCKKLLIDSKSDNFDIPETLDKKFRGVEHQNSFFQYVKFFQAVEMMKSVESETGQNYDLVIKTRCDLLYHPIDFGPAENSLIIDSGNVFPNDVILISKRDNIINIMNFISTEFQYPKYDDSHTSPPHGMLGAAIRHLNIPVNTQKIMMCAVRKGNRVQYY